MQARLERHTLHIVWLIACLHFLITATFGFIKILTFKSSFDLAVFDQIFWMLKTSGIPTITTQPPYSALHAFGWHFSPIFYLFSPLYNSAPSPLTLQIIHHLCISFSAIPLAFALRRFDQRGVSLIAFVALYLFNPFVFNATLWEFHETSLACLWMCFALWAFSARHKPLLLLTLLALILTKEHYGLAVIGFGILWGYHHKEWGFATALMLGGMIVFSAILLLIIPWLNDGSPHPMLAQTDTITHVSRFFWLKEPFSRMVAFAMEVFVTGHAPAVMYGCALLLFFGLFPLGAIVFVAPALADLAVNLLSINPMLRSLSTYHSVTIIPVLTLAAAVGLSRLSKQGRIKLTHPEIWFALPLVVCFYITGMSLASRFELLSPTLSMDAADVTNIHNIVKDRSITTQDSIGFLFSARTHIVPLRAHIPSTDMYVFHLAFPFSDPGFDHANMLYEQSPGTFVSTVKALLLQQDIQVAYFRNNWLVLSRLAAHATTDKKPALLRLEEMEKTLH